MTGGTQVVEGAHLTFDFCRKSSKSRGFYDEGEWKHNTLQKINMEIGLSALLLFFNVDINTILLQI